MKKYRKLLAVCEAAGLQDDSPDYKILAADIPQAVKLRDYYQRSEQDGDELSAAEKTLALLGRTLEG
jgi:hypothetical protein